MRLSISTLLTGLVTAALLAGCSPTFNWRDYHSKDAPYRVMFPDKPDSQTRSINLDGLAVDMTMTGARVEGTVFAVGSGVAPSEAQAQAAVDAMKLALVRNIGATIQSEKPGKLSADPKAAPSPGRAIDVIANGTQRGQAIRLVGHFEARGKRFYQVIVIGPPAAASDENVEMFLSSFKLN